MPDLRILFRHVYGKQYELLDRSFGYGIKGQRNHTCGIFGENSIGKTCGYADYGTVKEGYQTKGYHD
jgi:hypothetical protein